MTLPELTEGNLYNGLNQTCTKVTKKSLKKSLKNKLKSHYYKLPFRQTLRYKLLSEMFLILPEVEKLFFFIYDTGSKNGIIRVLCLKCMRKSMEQMSKHLKIGYQQKISQKNPRNYPKVESVNADYFFDNFYNNQTVGMNIRVNLGENKLTKKFYKNGMIYSKQVDIVNQKMIIISKKEKKISYYDDNLYEIGKIKSISLKIACKSKYLNSHKNSWCGMWLKSREKIYFNGTNLVFNLEEIEQKDRVIILLRAVKNATNTKIITTLNEKFTNISMEVFPSTEKEKKTTINENLVTNLKSTIRKTSLISTKENEIPTIESAYKYTSSVGNFATDHSPTTETLNSTFSLENYRKIDFYYLPVDITLRIFSFKKVLIDCLTNCSDRGKCISYDENTYQCLCAKNYSGRECQIDLRPCKWNLCLNNGVCVMRGKKSYECLCGKNHYGSNCQFEVDVCKNETCSRNGYCHAKNYMPKCKCFYLYSGVKCEIESGELRFRKIVSKVSSIVAIIVIVCFWLILISLDICNFMFFAPEKKAPSKKKEIPTKLFKSHGQIEIKINRKLNIHFTINSSREEKKRVILTCLNASKNKFVYTRNQKPFNALSIIILRVDIFNAIITNAVTKSLRLKLNFSVPAVKVPHGAKMLDGLSHLALTEGSDLIKCLMLYLTQIIGIVSYGQGSSLASFFGQFSGFGFFLGCFGRGIFVALFQFVIQDQLSFTTLNLRDPSAHFFHRIPRSVDLPSSAGVVVSSYSSSEVVVVFFRRFLVVSSDLSSSFSFASIREQSTLSSQSHLISIWFQAVPAGHSYSSGTP
ncbi:Neurogenic locus Notch [Brachionus plicatilis]|uniref:Neurogenic locus Notch n=1 Tax=Brachionus plicatilis TaxID=10195 RepID=A0A3M7S5B7_BRAPC|nr:Neurogenic locus Notch [Brachionus plicatilis]